MDDIIIINGVEYPCQLCFTTEGINVDLIIIHLNITHDEAVEICSSDVTLVVKYDDLLPLTDYKIFHSIADYLDGTIDIVYKKMTPLEKMIELHYGGIN